jgi:hypothetical protein
MNVEHISATAAGQSLGAVLAVAVAGTVVSAAVAGTVVAASAVGASVAATALAVSGVGVVGVTGAEASGDAMSSSLHAVTVTTASSVATIRPGRRWERGVFMFQPSLRW